MHNPVNSVNQVRWGHAGFLDDLAKVLLGRVLKRESVLEIIALFVVGKIDRYFVKSIFVHVECDWGAFRENRINICVWNFSEVQSKFRNTSCRENYFGVSINL